jgi:hypothetical protein
MSSSSKPSSHRNEEGYAEQAMFRDKQKTGTARVQVLDMWKKECDFFGVRPNLKKKIRSSSPYVLGYSNGFF